MNKTDLVKILTAKYIPMFFAFFETSNTQSAYETEVFYHIELLEKEYILNFLYSNVSQKDNLFDYLKYYKTKYDSPNAMLMKEFFNRYNFGNLKYFNYGDLKLVKSEHAYFSLDLEKSPKMINPGSHLTNLFGASEKHRVIFCGGILSVKDAFPHLTVEDKKLILLSGDDYL